jgi:hypothetical protein
VFENWFRYGMCNLCEYCKECHCSLRSLETQSISYNSGIILLLPFVIEIIILLAHFLSATSCYIFQISQESRES